MEFFPTELNGVYKVSPKVFEDNRGKFFETYRHDIFAKHGIDAVFVQDNQSESEKGVIRGLHYQIPPFAQGKLIRVTRGSVIDIILDLRKNSETFKKYISIYLNEEDKTMLWIPQGFAHGFASLEDKTTFQYMCTNFYNPEAERGIRWNDPDLAISWPVKNQIVSKKDQKLPLLKDILEFF